MKFEIIRNDITNMNVDAIVLPANSKLKEGTGTSNAIFEKAGRKELVNACNVHGKVEVGSSVPTLAYNLDAKYILHTVVPKWKNGKHHEYEMLSTAYFSTLFLADQIGCESVAFPLLAAGNNGFDLQLAYEIAKESIESFVAKKTLNKVYLTVYDRKVVMMLESNGIEVQEIVDEMYVLQKQEDCKLPVQRAIEDSKDIAQKFLEDSWAMARDYLNNPENRKKLIEQGAKIAWNVIEKKAKDKLGLKQIEEQKGH